MITGTGTGLKTSLALEAYQAERVALIQEDRALRSDFVNQNLTPSEVKADQIVRKIRAAEAVSIWNADYESVPHPFPGMEFLTGRSIVLRTKLFELLSKMPKGGLLHAHLDATVNAATLLKLALQQPAIHIRVNNILSSSNIVHTLPEFRALPLALFSDASSLTDESYTPNTWVSVSQARENFASTLGGAEGFDQWVLNSMMIYPAEAYGTHNTIEKIWQKFRSTFDVSTGIIRFVPIFTSYIRDFFLSSIEDGISYIEARVNFLFKHMVGEDGQENVPHREWVLIFESVLSEVKEELKNQGRQDEFFGARIIYCTIRNVTEEELEWYLDDCINLKMEFPHLIAGFDLVGDENVLKPLIDYVRPLMHFREQQRKLGLDIPFIFHAGETLGDGTKADDNLYDAILLGTKRIGHGFSLVKHPKLMQICREKDIAIEVCPISNEILRLTSSTPMHPLPILLNNGIPVALCSDDPAVFGNMGLTFDFFQVLVSSEVTGLIALREMARNSIKYSTLEAEEKQRAFSSFESRWIKFVDEVASSESVVPLTSSG